MATNDSEFVGFATPKVILRKKQFQWIAPMPRTFDINMSEFITGPQSPNIRKENILIDQSVGAAIVQPLYVNRNNYIVSSSQPEQSRYKADVPKGAPAETTNEISKRVFRSKPTYFQLLKSKGVVTVGDFVNPWEAPPDNYNGPIWREEAHESNFSDPSLDRAPYTTWIHQTNSSPNVEWFLCQEYGNFTNESFWIDVVKYQSSSPQKVDDPQGYNRYIRYGNRKEILAYFAIRIGWDNIDPQEKFSNVLNVKNQNNGPYDIVFPIDGSPFIYDHQGEEILIPDKNGTTERTKFVSQYNGYVADEQDNAAWMLKNDISSFRIYFYILRGKLIIKSTFAGENAWVFPTAHSTKSNENTRSRYENFYVSPGKVCLLGRGFSFRFSYNPLEFNIYENGKERKTHGLLTTYAMQERQKFGAGEGGWADIDGNLSGDKECLFVKIPYDKTRDPGNQDELEKDITKAFGFDVVTEAYAQHGSAVNAYTSMMIPVNQNEPSSIKKLVDSYFRDAKANEDVGPESSQNYGLQVSSQYNFKFKNRFFQIELRCQAPSFNSGADWMYTNGISKRFASPVVWRFRGDHLIPPLPVPIDYDITNYVKSISYSHTAADVSTIRQNFTIEVYVPKETTQPTHPIVGKTWTNADYTFGTMTRQELLELLIGGVREVEIWLGWVSGKTKDPVLVDGSTPPHMFDATRDFENAMFPTLNSGGSPVSIGKRVRVFTGITRGGPLQQTYGVDTISLKCTDRMEILQGMPIINSPVYDGMAEDRAYMHICQLYNLPVTMFGVKSKWANHNILPMGYTFLEPKFRFDVNTPLLEAVKKLARLFMHVLRTGPDGTIYLTDFMFTGSGDFDYGTMAMIDDQPLTHSSYEFFVDGVQNHSGSKMVPNAFQRIYDVFVSERSIEDQVTQLMLMTVDREDGSIIMDGTAFDTEAIENPDSPNFIGYSKPMRYTQPALGDKEHIRIFKNLVSKHVFQPPIQITFHTYGRATLKPLDIIGVHHSEKTMIDPQVVADKYAGDEYFLKYRVLTVSGSVDHTDTKWGYRCDVVAEHL